MEAFRRAISEYLALFQKMSASQRATLIAVPAMILVAFGMLIFQGQSQSEVAVSYGKVFSTQELISAEQSLIEAGLTDFRREGQRLMVPTRHEEKYNAVLLTSGSLPDNWAHDFEKSLEKHSIWTGSETRDEYRQIALAKELRRILQAVPDIKDASVVWARSKDHSRWPLRRQRVTATVSILPRYEGELSGRIVNSVRSAVASMVADLKPEDVTIFNQSTGISNTLDSDSNPFDNKLIERIKQFEQLHQNKIHKHLAAYIPNVVVAVHVDVDNVKSSVLREQTVDPKKTVNVSLQEQTVNNTSQQQPVNREVGLGPNQPRQLAETSGTQRSEQNSRSNVKSVSAPSFQVKEQQFVAAFPEAVQVSVAVPEEYYQAVARQKGKAEGTTDESKQQFQREVDQIQQEVEQKVKQTVATLIPKGSPDTAIHVSSYVRVNTDQPQVSTPYLDIFTHGFSQLWGALGLALFAIWALRLLYKSMPALPDEQESANDLMHMQNQLDEEKEVQPLSPDLERRETLQNNVRDNPELAATVLTKWMKTTK